MKIDGLRGMHGLRGMVCRRLFFSIAVCSMPQYGYAESHLTGVVLDPLRAAVTSARVSATLEGRSLATTVNTTADGRFSLFLEPGLYRLRVAADGFRGEARSVDFRQDSPPVEIVLQLVESRETVTVTETLGYQAPAASALKSPTLLINVPQAVSVINREQMRDQSMQNMADVVRYIPGITMAQGEGHRDAPVIRGNSTTADFYVNGVRDDVQYFRDLYNLDRVEAVKGANALTFGRAGGGGVINRVTKQAEFLPLSEISLQGGTFGNKRFTTDLSRSINEKVAFRLNGLYENSNSFRHSVDLERYGIAPTATFKLGDRTLVRVSYEYFNDGRVVDRGIPSFGGRPSNAHRSTFFGDPGKSFATAGMHIGTATLERQLGLWVLRNTFLTGEYDKFYQNIFPGAVNAQQTLVGISGYNNQTGRRNLFNQTDLSGVVTTGSLRHTILAGSEFGRQHTSNFRSTAYFNGTATSINVPFASPNVTLAPEFRQGAADADNRATNRVSAAFVQDQIELNRFVQVVAGVRYDYFNTNFFDNRTNQPLSRGDNLVAPRLGLVVKPVSNLSLYGSYSVSYLPGSGDQFASLNATTSTLRPERFNNYEIGAKMEVNRRLSLTAALYRLDRNNSTARDPNNPAITVQTGSQRTNGVEAGINGWLTSRWQVVGGYATQEAFVSSPTTAAPLNAKVALVPRHTFSLWNNYRVLARFSLGLGTIHQGAMWAGIDNTVRLPSFTRTDVAAFYTLTEIVRLQANVENLLDTTYYPTAHSNSNILPGAPRTLRIGLVARF
ncbi:MAG: TonB-dependent siderophore receptor [Bryobacteraceae bacterium]